MIELVLVLVWSGLLLWLGAVALTTWALLRPPRLTPPRAMARLGRMCPSDIGLRFEELEFQISDVKSDVATLKIAGWWIEAHPSSDRSVLIIHGYADSRAGALSWAPAWLELGWNVLLIDLRAHGESGGTYTTAGLREKNDIRQVVEQIRSEKPQQTDAFMLFGASMGAAVALAAGEITPGIAGVVVDSPVADFYHGAATQLRLMGLPGKVVLRPGLWLFEGLIGARFLSIKPAEVIDRLRCPVLVLAPGDDPFLPPSDAANLATAVEQLRKRDEISQLLTFKGATHLLPLHLDATEYKEALNRFCNACKPDRLARAPVEGSPAGRLG